MASEEVEEDTISFFSQSLNNPDVKVEINWSDIYGSLQPGAWLENYSIDPYCAHLIVKSLKSADFGYVTIEETKSLLAEDPSDLLINKFRQLTRQFKWIFLPVHASAHFYLIFIDVDEKSFTIFDSIKLSNERKADINNEAAKIAFAINWRLSDITVYFEQNAPIQENSFDCGLYVIHHIERIVAEQECQEYGFSAHAALKLRETIMSHLHSHRKQPWRDTDSSFGSGVDTTALADLSLSGRSPDSNERKRKRQPTEGSLDEVDNKGTSLDHSEKNIEEALKLLDKQLLHLLPKVPTSDTGFCLPIMNLHRINWKSGEEEIQHCIQRVVAHANKASTTENRFEEVTSLNHPDFILYTKDQDYRFDPVLRFFGHEQEISGSKSCVLFCKVVNSLFVFTNKKAGDLVKKFADFSFPMHIANQLLSHDGAGEYVERAPLGKYRGKKVTTKSPLKINEVEEFSVINTFSAPTRIAIINMAEGTRVDVGLGRIKFHHGFKLQEIIPFLGYLEVVYKITRVVIPVYTNRMVKLDYDDKVAYDELLAADIIGSIFGKIESHWVSDLDICHKFYSDFSLANEKYMTVSRDAKTRWKLNRYPTMNEILKLIRKYTVDNNWNASSTTIKQLNRFKISFITRNGSVMEPLMDFVEGVAYFHDNNLIRIDKCWYYLSGDLILGMERRFRRILNAYFIKNRNDPWHLKPWNKHNGRLYYEGSYNASFEHEPNFTLGDKKTDDTLGVELMDLMRVDGLSTHLYHVKVGFDGSGRTLCSQIFNCADQLMGFTLQNGKREQIGEYGRSLNFKQSEIEKILGISGKSPNKVTLVMAIVNKDLILEYPNGELDKHLQKPNTGICCSLREEMNKTFTFTRDDLKAQLTKLPSKTQDDIKQGIPTDEWIDRILGLLVKNDFCVEENTSYNITSKLLYLKHQDLFEPLILGKSILVKEKNELKKHFRNFLNPWITSYKTILAKKALIELDKQLSEFSQKFKFKICEISTYEVSEPDPNWRKGKKDDKNKIVKPTSSQKKGKPSLIGKSTPKGKTSQKPKFGPTSQSQVNILFSQKTSQKHATSSQQRNIISDPNFSQISTQAVQSQCSASANDSDLESSL